VAARETALNVLIACRKDGAWSNGVLKTYIVRDRLDKREAALASRLCYGVLQNRGKLDFYLQQLLTGKLKNLHPVVRDILHLGLYQLLETDKIPDSAAVNESVSLAKKYCPKLQNAPSLVNAVLRNGVRQRETLQKPTALKDLYSHPQNLIDLLSYYVGPQRLEAMLQANNSAPHTFAQVNTLRTDVNTLLQQLEQEGIGAQIHPWLSDCLILSETGNLEKLPSFQQGLFYIQDPAAKLSVLCAQLPQKPIRILDCCAAPGGKSFAAAMQTAGQAEIISCDIHPHKAALLQKAYDRVHALYPEKCREIERCLKALSQLEKSGDASIDAVTNLSARMVGVIYRWREDLWAGALTSMGEGIGRFVYLMDAYDDLEDDLRKKRYNPLKAYHQNEDYETFVRDSLTMLIAESTEAFETLPLVQDMDILRNILYAGCWSRYQLKQHKRDKQRGVPAPRKEGTAGKSGH